MISNFKILFITPDNPIDGPIARRLSLLCKGINDQGFANAKLISTQPGNIKTYHSASDTNDYGIEYSYLPIKSNILFYCISSILKGYFLTKYIKNMAPSCIITYESSFYKYLTLIFYCNKNHIPIITDITEWYQVTLRRLLNPAFIEHLLFRKYFYRLFSGTISISFFYHSYFTFVNHKSIYIPALSEDYHHIPSVYKPLNSQLTITYVGRFSNRDEPAKMLNAFKTVLEKGFKLTINIVGKITPSASSNNLLQTISSNPVLQDNVQLKGFIPRQEYQYILRKTDIFILLHEDSIFSKACFPTRLPEFFSTQKPVITTAIGDISESFVHREHVMLIDKSNDPTLISDAIIQLIKNPALAYEIGIAGAKRAVECFSYLTNTKKLINFINQQLITPKNSKDFDL